MDDQMIISLFWERSEEAVRELAQKYGRLFFSLAEHIVGNEQDAEECVNDTYLALWNRIPPERPGHLSAYAGKIVRNLALKKYHSNTAAKRDCRYQVVLEELEDCLALRDDVGEGLLAQELSQKINHFLQRQKEKDRVIFVKRYWLGRTVGEIAAEMGQSVNYINVHLHRTRERLKEYLKEENLYEGL